MVIYLIETLKTYLNKEEYYFIITSNYLYIKNYTNLLSMSENEILLNIKNNNYRIKGKELTLKRSENKELLIYGVIESINRYD